MNPSHEALAAMALRTGTQAIPPVRVVPYDLRKTDVLMISNL